MSITRRSFFLKLCGGIGSLGLANTILSQRGWVGFLAPGKAYANPAVYELRPGFTFFEGQVFPPPHDMPAQGAARRAAFPTGAQIIDHNVTPKQAYRLNDTAAFIARVLLMEVDSAFLSQIYASKFNKTPQQASQEIDTVINGTRNFPSFFQVKQPAHLSPAPPSSTRSNFTRIDWADFSVGSVYAIGGIKKPA